jgi:hypothetical protein
LRSFFPLAAKRVSERAEELVAARLSPKMLKAPGLEFLDAGSRTQLDAWLAAYPADRRQRNLLKARRGLKTVRQRE